MSAGHVNAGGCRRREVLAIQGELGALSVWRRDIVAVHLLDQHGAVLQAQTNGETEDGAQIEFCPGVLVCIEDAQVKRVEL